MSEFRQELREPALEQPSPTARTGASGPRAGFWRRFGAYLVDGILIWVIVFLVLRAFLDEVAAQGITVLVSLIYFTYFEGTPSGQSIGKKLLNIRVIDFATGGPIGHGRAFLRWVGRILSGIPLALGYLWMLWDKEKQTWHDKIANCVVVPTGAYPVERWPG
jgi:uncharacterized RDD family membrane protein YckC